MGRSGALALRPDGRYRGNWSMVFGEFLGPDDAGPQRPDRICLQFVLYRTEVPILN